MARREDFDNSFWDDPEIDALSASATLLYIWSWTNRRCGMSGVYKVVWRRCAESKVAEGRLEGAFGELASGGLAFYRDGWLWVKGRVGRVRPRSPQMAKSIRTDLEQVPVEHPFRGAFLEKYGEHAWLREELRGVGMNVTGPSRDLHVIPGKQGESVNLTRTSPEVHPNFHGNGKGKGNDNNDLEVRVFEAWLQASGRTTRTLFDDRRRRVVRRALEDYPVEDVTDAVRGWRHSAHHRGENATGTVYNDLELLLRDAKHIEMFRDLERGAGLRAVPSSQSAGDRVIDGSDSWKADYPNEDVA